MNPLRKSKKRIILIEMSCQCVFKGCGQPVVPTEKFCPICISEKANQDRVSEKYKSLNDKLLLDPYIIKPKILSSKYDYVLERSINGEFHLKGIAVLKVVGVDNETDREELDYTGEVREATEEERVEAASFGILV